MSPGAMPFWSVLVAALLGGVYFVTRWELYRFEQPNEQQFCAPAISEGTRSFGRDVGLLPQLEPYDLVRYQTARFGPETTARVVALAGDRVRIEAGKIFVNDQPFADKYQQRGAAAEWLPELLVPAECVFVLHDVRRRGPSDRRDSRALGPISVHAISLAFSPKER